MKSIWATMNWGARQCGIFRNQVPVGRYALVGGVDIGCLVRTGLVYLQPVFVRLVCSFSLLQCKVVCSSGLYREHWTSCMLSSAPLENRPFRWSFCYKFSDVCLIGWQTVTMWTTVTQKTNGVGKSFELDVFSRCHHHERVVVVCQLFCL